MAEASLQDPTMLKPAPKPTDVSLQQNQEKKIILRKMHYAYELQHSDRLPYNHAWNTLAHTLNIERTDRRYIMVDNHFDITCQLTFQNSFSCTLTRFYSRTTHRREYKQENVSLNCAHQVGNLLLDCTVTFNEQMPKSI